ncbi:uncharacterized protein FFMR_00582 [Fusarium fujikuroi]
MPPAG